MKKQFTPDNIQELQENEIFVFGSNEAGRHGAGAAKTALDKFGAKLGKGFGISGNSFAIPTKDTNIKTLPLNNIEEYIAMFIIISKNHKNKLFYVTEIGCGLAGYTPDDIAPFFRECLRLSNIILPESFINVLNKKKFIYTYKMTDENMKCRDFQFELGIRYEHQGQVKICNSGFHSCIKAQNVLNYYKNNGRNRLFLCEVELNGNEDFENGDNIEISEKLCSSNITFIEEVTNNISYLFNTGNRNTGDWNTGDWNTGDWNTGDLNTGDLNTGNRNTGNRNTGDRNTGDRNTGSWNTGDRNTGDLNTTKGPWRCFNVIQDKEKSNYYFPNWLYFNIIEWVNESNMTEQEKSENIYYNTVGGYLKSYDYKEAAQLSYSKATKEEQRCIEDLPNYSHELLFEIFGIDRTEDQRLSKK